MNSVIETFYTGGGIWLAESLINDVGDYAVVSSDCPEILSLYHKSKEKYLPEDMFFSEHYSKLEADLLSLYLEMFLDLKEEME